MAIAEGYLQSVASKQIWKWGQTSGAFFRAPHFLALAYTSAISNFDERFRGDQYSLVSFMFAVLLLTVPRNIVGLDK